MEINTQPLLRQLFETYAYIDGTGGVMFSEAGALLDEIGQGIDYATLMNGLEVLTATGVIARYEEGYASAIDNLDFEGFKAMLMEGLNLEESKLILSTFGNDGIKTITPEGDIEYWKAYVPTGGRYLLPYLEGLDLITFSQNGRMIHIPKDNVIARTIMGSLLKSSRRRKSLDTLLAELEAKRRLGAIAENIAMIFERKRLSVLAQEKLPELISNDYVNAGYDMLSYMDGKSTVFDRHIEVKAASPHKGFYMSRNEIEQAKELGASYFLYLVDVTRSTPENPVVEIIRDPAKTLFDDDADWIRTVESYRFEPIGKELDEEE